MSFEVRTEFGNLDPEAKRALVAMQHAIRSHLDDVDRRARRPKRAVTEVVEEGGVFAKPGQVVRVKPGDTDVQVVLPTPDAGNGGEDIIVSFEGDGTATGKVLVTPANSTCANPGTTTLNTPGTYRFTSTGAPGENPSDSGSTWGGPAPLSFDDLPDVASDSLLGNISGSTGNATEVPLASLDSASIVYDAASHTFQRAAISGAVSAAQDANATKFAGIRDNNSLETARGFINYVSTTSILADVGQDAGNDELEVSLQRAALSGAITAAQNGNSTTYSGIRSNGVLQTAEPFINVVNTTSILGDAGVDGANQELEFSFQRAALSGAIVAAQNSNATVFAGIRDNNAAETDRTNLNFVNTTSVLLDVGQDAGNDEMEISAQRAALTGEVTASQNSNATTVTRSTDFSTSGWTGNHKFGAQMLFGAEQADASTGSVNVTLGDVIRLRFTSASGDITLGQVSGCAEGRVLVVEYSGTGIHTVTHDAATGNAISCPGSVDLVMAGRSGFIAVGRGSPAVWKIIGVSRTAIDVITASYASASSVTNSTTPITLASLTIPAGSLSAGACFEFFGAVNWTRTGATASSVKLSLKINGTIVAFYQTATSTAGVPGDASIHGFFNFLAVGASGSVKGRLADSEFAPFGSTSATNFITASGLDTTSAITVAVTAEMTVATTQLTINGNAGLVQKRAASGSTW